ncbi:glycoprotein 6-alpha-L-fucosyltransferase [Aureococcus anophagefferens]|nr:glycoprotein 6-alpha-L-fucosyltransferase [Aureococcus anophagefferens]
MMVWRHAFLWAVAASSELCFDGGGVVDPYRNMSYLPSPSEASDAPTPAAAAALDDWRTLGETLCYFATCAGDVAPHNFGFGSQLAVSVLRARTMVAKRQFPAVPMHAALRGAAAQRLFALDAASDARVAAARAIVDRDRRRCVGANASTACFFDAFGGRGFVRGAARRVPAAADEPAQAAAPGPPADPARRGGRSGSSATRRPAPRASAAATARPRARLHARGAYAAPVGDLARRYGYATVVVATDSDAALAAFVAELPRRGLGHLNVVARRSRVDPSVFGEVQRLEHAYAATSKHAVLVEPWTEYYGFAADLLLLARCDGFVGKFTSNLSRLAFALMAARKRCMVPYVSLDSFFCAGGGGRSVDSSRNAARDPDSNRVMGVFPC